MKTCPFCYMEDLADQATKCPHCAAWLNGAEENQGGLERLRQDVRQEFRDDLISHREYLDSLLSRVQWTAGVILALVVGAAAFFGFRTDQSITDIMATIEDQAEAKITQQVDNEIGSEKMRGRIEAQVNLASENIKKVIDESVSDLNARAQEQVNKFTTVSVQLDEKVKDLQKRIDPTAKKLDEIEGLANRAKKEAIRTTNAIIGASNAPVDERLASLPVEAIELSEKGGVGEIAALMEDRINALNFRLGHGGYYGPAIWQYFANLTKLPEFRYVVITNNDDESSLFGVFDARSLSSALNPPNAGELSAQYPLSEGNLPGARDVQAWTAFADQLNAGASEELPTYPGFVPGGAAVTLGSDKQTVLNRMEELHADWLPVVDGGNWRFAGIIDRSRLTASLVLEIARGLKQP